MQLGDDGVRLIRAPVQDRVILNAFEYSLNLTQRWLQVSDERASMSSLYFLCALCDLCGSML